ncbi:MAG TPA: glycosyltransferase [Thermoanaerobaculia bacterium]|nr:glycosyltransferase [Thermoanaerobaculia bacterium]
MRIILSGAIGRSVTGGQAWANLQYLIGLRALGHEVFYLEDCGGWSTVHNWETNEPTWDLDYPAGFVRACLEPFGFGGRWIYRAGDESRGLSLADFSEVCRAADLLIVRGIPFLEWRRDYELPRRRAFIDVDPGFTQIRLARGEPAFAETLARCEALFTVGRHVGAADCSIPTAGREWMRTVPPVVLSEWPAATSSDDGAFTSIVRWRGLKDVEWEGVKYGQRDRELLSYLSLPQLTSQRLQIALTGGGSEKCVAAGWDVTPGWLPSRTVDTYRQYIQQSRGELTVAKHCYVATRSGWFSDRSVCYLASGRPVLVQDTGLGDWLPVGEGILVFRDLDQAVEAIDAVNADYPRHRRAARRLAESHFAAERVLPELIANVFR